MTSIKASLLQASGLAVLATMMAAPGVYAQSEGEGASASAPRLEVITVTSRKRPEVVTDVPMNISVTDVEQLARRNTLNKEDLFRSIAGAASPTGTLILRGLSGGNSAAPSTTSSFFDDIPLDWSELYDVKSVEVLRGPQGTLYGSNAIGGTVRVITNAPDLQDFSAFGSAQTTITKHEDGLDQRVYFGVNLPLIEDQLALRVVAHTSDDAGEVLNAYTGHFNSADRRYVRAKLLWEPQENWRASVGYVHNRTNRTGTTTLDSSEPGRYMIADLTHDASLPGGYSVDFRRVACEGQRAQCRGANATHGHPAQYTVWNMLDNWRKTELNLYTFNFEYDDLFGFADVFYAGSYRTTTGSRLEDWSRLDGSDLFKTWIITDDGDNHRTTHELRFQAADWSRFNWTFGYFYDRDVADANPNNQWQYIETTPEARSIINAWLDPDLNAWGGDVFAAGEALYGDRSRIYQLEELGSYTQEQALFAQLGYTFDIGQYGELELNAGVRFYELEDESKSISSGVWFGEDLINSTSSGSESGNRKKFTVSWRPRQEFAFYGVYSEGYRPGGNNFPVLPDACAADENAKSFTSRYNSDEITNYELGFKGYLFKNRLQVSSAIYRVEWDGVWASIYMPTCGFSYTANAASAQSQGIELETETLIREDLRLIINAGYTDSKMTSDAPSIGAEDGDDMTMVPDYNVYVALEKDLQVFGRDAYVRGDVTAYGEYVTHFNTRAEDSTPAYEIVNLSAGVELNESAKFSVYLNNVLDENYETYRQARSRSAASWNSANYVTYGERRSLTLRLDVTF
ncbi:TonB-dependent receptor [Woodsholea maritima]|uniref:TonB-dependent receptor n=1 Tax=Woodsholea maritima TaxID=240237 RepID=UPI00037B4F74|nr:TonB-dependent receptor plug domain-containing protein [Woodsholea maritima]